MRCAILKLASEPLTGLDRLPSLAIQETTDRRLSDHPPPSCADEVTRDQEAWLFQDCSKVGPIVGGRMDHVTN